MKIVIGLTRGTFLAIFLGINDQFVEERVFHTTPIANEGAPYFQIFSSIIKLLDGNLDWINSW